MMWRVFMVVALLLILAGASSFLVEAGFVPWIVPVLTAAVALVFGGVIVRRRRGTQTPLAVRERRTKLHTRDLATHPPPGPKTEIADHEPL